MQFLNFVVSRYVVRVLSEWLLLLLLLLLNIPKYVHKMNQSNSLSGVPYNDLSQDARIPSHNTVPFAWRPQHKSLPSLEPHISILLPQVVIRRIRMRILNYLWSSEQRGPEQILRAGKYTVTGNSSVLYPNAVNGLDGWGSIPEWSQLFLLATILRYLWVFPSITSNRLPNGEAATSCSTNVNAWSWNFSSPYVYKWRGVQMKS
jgi:hypothetical protein